MNDNTKKVLKISGVCLAAVAAVFLIAMMFVLLSFMGAFGYDVQHLNVSFNEARDIDLQVPLAEKSQSPLFDGTLTVYPEKMANSKAIAAGKAACGAYSWQTPLDFFCAAKTDGSFALPFEIFKLQNPVKIAENAALGDIFAAVCGDTTVYYAEKDGVRYAYIPLNRAPLSPAAVFNEVFVFA